MTTNNSRLSLIDNTELFFETQQVKELYDLFIAKCKKKIVKDDIKPIIHAFAITSSAFKGLRRKTGEPLIIHPLLVATIVVDEIGLAKNSIISALMHDLFETDHAIKQQICQVFGNTVGIIIEGLNKISGLYSAGISTQSDKYIDLLLSIVPDVRIILVKLADRLQTLRSINLFEFEDRYNMAMEAGLVFAPIAHRLGLYPIKAEMEELWLKHTKPGVFVNITTKLEETSTARDQYIAKFIEPIRKELTDKGFKFEIKSRVKSIFSIWKKMEAQQARFEDLYDIFAIRIILDNITQTDEKMACWTVYSVVSNLYTPNPSRMRDWISTPRKSGYESLHATVLGYDEKMWVEVQIRTRRMDDVAEKGTAAHWKYKEVTGGRVHQQWLAKIREILEKPEIGDSENYFNTTPDPTKDIFVFTPKGELKQLSFNATVLDFAYSIHSNIGDKCTGARVNGRMAPIKQILKSGDTVDVITSKTQTPNENWLSFAISSKARNRIKRSLKDQIYKEAEIGKETLNRKLSQASLSISDEQIVTLLKKFGYKNIIDLYHSFALGKIDFTTIKQFLISKSNPVIDQKDIPLPFTEKVKKSKYSDENYLIIDKDISHIDYKLAKCCTPIFGDPVFGFVSIEKGITIHRINCPNAEDMTKRYPYRIIKAKWNKLDPDGRFMVKIMVKGVDQKGVLNQLTKLFVDDLHLNISSAQIDTDNGIFSGIFTVYVKDTNHIDFIIRQIVKSNGVMTAERV